MTHNLTGSADDVTYAFTLNPAGQAVSRDVSNPAYQFAMPTQAATPYVRDGLNQYDAVNGVAFTHDRRGNLTSDGVTTWQFDAENKLQWVYGPAVATRTDNDPIGRLRAIHQNGVVTVLLWDGDRLVGQLDGSGNWQASWAHGPGPDEPLAEWYKPVRTWLLADHQGSIVGETGSTGALIGTPFTYDPYGRPDAAHGFAGPRFRYTGQIMITPEVDLWHYKARAYDPDLGRFLQTDPVGYEEGLNLYAYVGNDPFNGTDPTGMIQLDGIGVDAWRVGEGGITQDPGLDLLEPFRAAGKWLNKEWQEDPVGLLIDGGLIAFDIATFPSGEAVAGIAARRATRELAGDAPGVVYLRTNPQTGRCYVGRCDSMINYERRQREHNRQAGVEYEFQVLERSETGLPLRQAEQRWIDAYGGPTRPGRPGGLENRRNEIAPSRVPPSLLPPRSGPRLW